MEIITVTAEHPDAQECVIRTPPLVVTTIHDVGEDLKKVIASRLFQAYGPPDQSSQEKDEQP